MYRGGRTRRRPSALQWVLTWTQVCVPAPKAPWSSHGGGLRQPLELHLSFQPHAGPAPCQGFLLHSEGWVTWQISPPLQPPEAPRQPASFAPQPCGWIFHGGKMGICWAQLGFRGHLGAALCCHTHTHLHAHTPAPHGHLLPSCQRKPLPFARLARSEDVIRRWVRGAEVPGLFSTSAAPSLDDLPSPALPL